MTPDSAKQPLAGGGSGVGATSDAAGDVVVDRFGLSPLQQGMLFHHVEDPRSGVDIEQLVVHVTEAVDPDALSRAWDLLVRRHPMLRARLVWHDEEPKHEILATISLPFAIEDLRDVAPEAQRHRLRAFLNDDRVRGFDLQQAPLLRVTLFRWAELSWSVVWTFHHVLLDGRTFPTLLGELFDDYEALRDNAPLPTPRPEPAPFRRHVEWLQQQQPAAGEAFFKTMLAGFEAPTPLVIDRLPAASPDTVRGEAWTHVDGETSDRLRDIAQAHGLTMNALVMGAWAVLLQRYSGDTDVVFGATRACRRSSVAGADSAIGLLINTVPVRVAIRDEDSLLDALHAIRQQWLAMRPFEHTPLARLKALSQVPAAQRLFHTLVVFENRSLEAAMRARGGAWGARRVELHELTSFPLTLAAYDGESLGLKLEFNRHTIGDDAGHRLLRHLQTLLNGIAARPDARIRELTLLTPGERDALIGLGEQPGGRPSLPAGGDATLHELFERQVARRPDAVAVRCGEAALTYSQLNAQANRLAHELVRHGIGPGVLVGLYVERSNALVVAVLAILKAGGAYLPLDRTYPADRIAFMLRDAEAPVIVTEAALAPALPPTPARVLCLDRVAADAAPTEEEQNFCTPVGPDDLAYVIYTSGTTGRPKGSLITHRNVVRLLESTERYYGFHEHDVWTLFHSCAFDFSVWEIWGALAYGGRLVVVPFIVSRSPEAFYDLLVREQVTVLNQTPSAFRQLVQAEETIGGRALALRYVIFGGEALDMRTLGPWFARHGDRQPQLVNMYGITETTVHVTHRPLSTADVTGGSVIGVPLPDLQTYVLDSRGEPAPIGIAGELFVGGAGLARGYLRRPELTRERFVVDHLSGRPGARLYRTGDAARRLANGDIEYLGRLDSQVKIRGFRVELGEIESVLTEHPAIREAVVVTRDDPAGGQRLVAYFSGRPAPAVSDVREHLASRLPGYMVPAVLVALEALPLTDNGKIDRRALPGPESERPSLATSYVAPATPSEATLATIWSRVLGVDRIGVHDNFFALGGDSILSIRVLSLARQTGLRLTPSQFFSSQTIAQLAAVAQVDEVSRGAGDSVSGDVPLTPIQAWFFEQEPEDVHHFNQAFLLETVEPLEREPLEAALAALRDRHDALRLRYRRVDGVWQQRYADPEAEAARPLPLTWASLTETGEQSRRAAIAELAKTAHHSLDLEQGPLWRVVYIDCGHGRRGRLLFVVHHLAVDGVSWRPLLEDLETSYNQRRDGRPLALPQRCASFKAWAVSTRRFAMSEALRAELPFWQAMVANQPHSTVFDAADGPETGGTDRTHVVSLTADETRALLHEAPSAYHTQINDVLLTALLRAWERCTGSSELLADLEGHGRETLDAELDLSSTVGWFTSMFPVRLRLPAAAAAEWHPGSALKSVKEQLRQVPRKGVGYGLLRYLAGDAALRAAATPALLFNYLGQFDQAIAASALFRFAPEASGPWRSPRQRRHHLVEINCLVIGGSLQTSWTCGADDATTGTVLTLAGKFLEALRELIAHCRSAEAWGRTPSDFPLAPLDQPSLDRLLSARRHVEDVLPLSPMQLLFLTAQRDARQAAFDQWQCTLLGPLDANAFQRAWSITLQRHSVLRSSVHSDGLPQPVTVVHADVKARWTFDDWRDASAAGGTAARWAAFLADDYRVPLSLTEAPAMRFALVRTADEAWKFAWSVPSMLLDGWSWPVVFHDVGQVYEALVRHEPPRLAPVRPYRDYLAWLAASDQSAGADFWREALAGFHAPTPLASEPPDPVDNGDRYARISVPLPSPRATALQGVARQLQVTLSAVVQAAWALLLGRQADAVDVVFGVAFSGRPAELPGVDSIVGPFVNNLPVRVLIDGRTSLPEFIRELHARLLEVSRFQFTPIVDVQRVSEVPWRQRLFESLVVVQNYLVGDGARRVGREVAMSDFSGPVHTNFSVLLLVEPENGGDADDQSGDGFTLRLTLVYDRHRVASAAVARWSADLARLMEQISHAADRPVEELQAELSAPAQSSTRAAVRVPATQAHAPARQTRTERAIAAIWHQLLNVDRIGLDENFFDAGGTSLLIVQLHHQLREALRRDLPLVELFEHPTVRSLARRLEGVVTSVPDAADARRSRAERQKQVLARTRGHRHE